MRKPHRIQLRRTKDWRLPPNTVVVSRPSKWGNPFRIGGSGINTAAVAVHEFERFWKRRLRKCTPNTRYRWRRELREIRGKNLACWCPLDQPCHADVLLEIANL